MLYTKEGRAQLTSGQHTQMILNAKSRENVFTALASSASGRRYRRLRGRPAQTVRVAMAWDVIALTGSTDVAIACDVIALAGYAVDVYVSGRPQFVSAHAFGSVVNHTWFVFPGVHCAATASAACRHISRSKSTNLVRLRCAVPVLQVEALVPARDREAVIRRVVPAAGPHQHHAS
jgi:hypothetical protein